MFTLTEQMLTHHHVEHDEILFGHFLDGLISNKCLLQCYLKINKYKLIYCILGYVQTK